MTLDELRERIKDEVVLHEGNVADYQWRQMGLTDEAAKIGVSGPDFGRLVNQVSLTVAPDLGRIADIREDILKLAYERRKKLTDWDIRRFVDDAERAHLTRSFVVDTWIPTLLRQVADVPESSVPEFAAPEPAPSAPRPAPVSPVSEPTAPTGETADSMRRKVTESLADYDGHIPAPAVRSLFRTINYNEAELSVAIWNYLQIHQYVPDREPQDGSLRDKLTSTDWRYPAKNASPQPIPSPGPERLNGVPKSASAETSSSSPAPVVQKFTATPGRVRRGQPVTLEWEVDNLLAVTIDDLGEGLSPRNRGWVKPTKTTDYTLFDVNNNPLSTVRVEVTPPDRSGLYGVLFALALLAIIYWFVRGNTANRETPPPERRTKTTQSADERQRPATPRKSRRKLTKEVATRESTESPSDPVNERNRPISDAPKPEPVTINKPIVERVAPAEPVAKPATPADARAGKYEEAFGNKPYDKVELGTDEQGWRRARSNGRWGFINQNDEWVIPPEYEAVTPFRGNTAGAFRNGQLITINRSGEPVRK